MPSPRDRLGQDGAMKALIITFELTGMTVDEWQEQGRGKAASYSSFPGLEAKIWLSGDSVDRVGAIYLFRDETALTEFTASSLMERIREHPNYVDVAVNSFEVVKDLTAETQGSVGIV